MSTLKIFRNLVLIIAALTMLAAILFLIVWIINRHDQPPSAEAKEFQEFYDQRPSIEHEKNAYIYLMGFDVPEAESPMDWGGRRVTWINRSLGAVTGEDYIELPGPVSNFIKARSPKVVDVANTCKQATPECIKNLNSDSSVVSDWLQQESWVVDRYSQLIDFSDWKETAKLHLLAPCPKYDFVINAQRVYLMSLWFDIQQEKNHKNVGFKLSRDLHFWRMVLKNSDILITKMIAVAAINNNFYWTNQIFHSSSVKNIDLAVPDEMNVSFDREDFSMHRTLVGEWVFSTESIGFGLEEYDTYLFSKYFFQKQDSSNIQAKMLKDFHDTVSVDISLVPEVLKRINTSVDSKHYFNKTGFLYNFFGKFLLRQAAPSLYTSYVARVADLEGARRALLLMTKIRSELAQGEDIGTFVKNSTIVNPYTQAPFIWDDKNKELIFVGLETGERGRHSFPL